MQTIAVYNSHTGTVSRFFHGLGRFFTPKRIFFILVLIFGFLFVAYMYLINATVENVVSYSALQKQIGTLSLAVDSLQSQDISLKSTVTLTMAHNAGYEDVNSPQFISVSSPGSNPAVAALSYINYP